MLTIPQDGQSPDADPAKPGNGQPGQVEHHSGDPDTLALNALGWVLADEQRADRLLSLTGLDAQTLRDHLTERSTLSAVMEFLVNHEPDLLLAADALGRTPEELVEAHRKLSA